MRRLAITVLGLAALAGTAAAEEKSGRYTMTPVDNGFVRLDTETGDMALCRREGAAWSCQAMADSSRPLQQEYDRLLAENKELKAEIKRLDEIAGLGDRKPGTDRPAPGFKLPSEQDVDKALDYVQRMVRKFKEKLRELERDEAPKTPL